MNASDNLLREVLEQYHEQAFKWAMSCCGYDREKARDVMQTVYMEILDNRAVFRRESGLRTWLFAVIRRTASRQSRLMRANERLKSNVARLVPLDDEPDDGPEVMDRQDRIRRVINALQDLSARQRQIVELVYYRDFTLEEAAQILGIGVGSVRIHFHRAKKTLAKRLASLKEQGRSEQ